MPGRAVKKTALLLSVLLAALMLLSSCVSPPRAEEPPASPAPSLPPAPVPRKAGSHKEVRVYFDGLLGGRGYYENETLYMAPEAVCDYFGLDTATETGNEGFAVDLAGIRVTGKAGV